ncbi:MAG: PEP-CTERM sorting domain-containing protein [Massilia sp.]|nr:MAG: PEP-CTERM sorting domain-containing protein [Massilia sp.]
MRLSKTRMFLLAAAVGLHLNAHASLIDPDETAINGLSWLQLHETAGLSLNDFGNGAGGWSTQFRLATDAEIGAMLSAIGLPMGYADYHPIAPGASYFTFSLGGPFGTGTDIANPIAAGRGLGWYAYARLTDGENGLPLSADCPAYSSCGMSLTVAAAQDANVRLDYSGLFVVRREAEVPEPSTLALMGLAGALAALRRRRA